MFQVSLRLSHTRLEATTRQVLTRQVSYKKFTPTGLNIHGLTCSTLMPAPSDWATEVLYGTYWNTGALSLTSLMVTRIWTVALRGPEPPRSDAKRLKTKDAFFSRSNTLLTTDRCQ